MPWTLRYLNARQYDIDVYLVLILDHLSNFSVKKNLDFSCLEIIGRDRYVFLETDIGNFVESGAEIS